jgi:hypothetical protein
VTRRRLRGALAAGLTAAVLGTTMASGAVAAQVTAPRPAPAGQAKLGINMLTQDQDEWCWVAAGLTIAQFLGKGKDIDQNTFCDYAHNLPNGQQCPNQPGEFSDDQAAFTKLGMNPGQNVDSTLPFDQMKAQIDAGKPIEVGILWAAGGGHANVLYGYDSDKNTMMYGDPWPSSARYGEMQYDQYVTNDQFHWAASLYGMG